MNWPEYQIPGPPFGSSPPGHWGVGQYCTSGRGDGAGGDGGRGGGGGEITEGGRGDLPAEWMWDWWWKMEGL